METDETSFIATHGAEQQQRIEPFFLFASPSSNPKNMSSGARREGALFLKPEEQFTFEFGGEAIQPSAEAVEAGQDGDAEWDENRGGLSSAPAALMADESMAPLTLQEVHILCKKNVSLGDKFLTLPANASSLDAAVQQYTSVIHRQFMAVKAEHKQRSKIRKDKESLKRGRE